MREFNKNIGEGLFNENGKIRTQEVAIYSCKHNPPEPVYLHDIAQKGFNFLNTIEEPKLKAVVTFLFMSRSQFFINGNKRTASIMMNGILMSNGFVPITLLEHNKDKFEEELVNFYESGNASSMLKFFSNNISQQFIVNEQGKRKKSFQR